MFRSDGLQVIVGKLAQNGVAATIALSLVASGGPAWAQSSGLSEAAQEGRVRFAGQPRDDTAVRAADPAAAGKPARKGDATVPTWARDARWYHVVVSRFYNGDRSNDPVGRIDPVGTQPRTTEGPKDEKVSSAEAQRLEVRPYGGDLQGLQERLPYLKDLGINTLYLATVFHTVGGTGPDAVDARHIDDSLGIKHSLGRIVGETDSPRTWKFSGSDRVFLGFLKAAHGQGFRVVLEAGFSNGIPTAGRGGDPSQHLLNLARRWMDPNADGDPSDGVDGWVVTDVGERPLAFWKPWRRHVKAINPTALLVLDGAGDPTQRLGAGFDVTLNHPAAAAIRRFFARSREPYPVKKFLEELTSIRERQSLDTLLASPIALSSPRLGRLLAALSPADSRRTGERGAGTLRPDENARALWRLAVIFQHFFPGAPITYYGDEAGLSGEEGPRSQTAIASKSLSGTDPASSGDFASLIQWLHIRRGLDAPMSRGGFQTRLVDEPRRILAFARSLPNQEAVLVMNYGPTKQKVMVPVGRPGQLVAVLGPLLGPYPPPKKAMRRSRREGRGQGAGMSAGRFPNAGKSPEPVPPRIRKLRMGSIRQFVNPEGRVRIWVNPMSVRVVLLQ